ncbi:hypothetical protein [Sabulibacter ruber]|uniref:hypothetical protein n=1 Tax=Sabulibacter ruber TaxID=2811901 RepID=UPI001A96BA0B|nr:hypothetical protein [Sabulibacter ruber]
MPTEIEQLREKIKSKMEVAKFFAGFMSVSSGLIAMRVANYTDDGLDWFNKALYSVGFCLVLAAIAFSIATMYAYDSLLMPLNHWKGEREPDPDNSELVIADQFVRAQKDATDASGKYEYLLFNGMIAAWKRLFQPSVWCFFYGSVFFTSSIAHQLLGYSIWFWFLSGALLLIPFVILFFWLHHKGKHTTWNQYIFKASESRHTKNG